MSEWPCFDSLTEHLLCASECARHTGGPQTRPRALLHACCPLRPPRRLSAYFSGQTSPDRSAAQGSCSLTTSNLLDP